jgi:hypothetical protein
MKKMNAFLAAAVLVLITFCAQAQSKPGADYFAGKWNVLVKGTPNGDSKMILSLDRKENTLSGAIQDTTGKETAKITSIELKDNEITVYFTTQGYDVNIALTKKDDDHATGSLMGMFDTEADRIKPTRLK